MQGTAPRSDHNCLIGSQSALGVLNQNRFQKTSRSCRRENEPSVPCSPGASPTFLQIPSPPLTSTECGGNDFQMSANIPSMGIISAGPCLPGSSRLRVSDNLRFSTIIGHAVSHQPSAVKLFTSSKKGYLPPPPLGFRICYITKHPPNFKPLSRAAKTPKTDPEASNKLAK